MARHAAVVGGGIGGLAAAIGLHRAGWEVTVHERAPEFGGIGAGLTLWPNAQRALRALGLGAELAPLLVQQPAHGLRDHRGRVLTTVDASAFERLLGDPLVGLHRAQLHKLLVDALPTSCLRSGHEVDELPEAELVIGADGLHSRVRQRLFPHHPGPVYSGSTAFRGVTTAIPGLALGVSFGPGAELGTVPLSDGRVYWYAAMNGPENTQIADKKAFLRKRFAGWQSQVPELFESTTEILHHDILWLKQPLPSYVAGNVALLGDAAHAMAPFLGQGGCQAIEDAVVLAAAVTKHRDLSQALAYYDQERRPRSQAVARASARAGRMGMQLSNPIAVALRNTLTRWMPSSIAMRASAGISDWTPPVIHSPTSPAS